ncbi:SORCN protein, partial [Piaya cayana]|nr:SORCN protein [Piaya cayana]
FNLETCRLMISMLDRDMSGTLGFNEFKELWAVVNGWKQHFLNFDNDRSGTVDRQELEKALMNMGFRLSPQAVSAITRRYSTHGKITFDDYIACCVKLRALTECFRRRDASQQGFVNFQYDDVSEL